MGINLPSIQLGDVTVHRIITGLYHTCALVRRGALWGESLTCWGFGQQGQLGHGRQDTIGDEAGEMGSSLHWLNFAGLNPQQVVAGAYHTCALLSDDTTRCWGDGSNGQLGTGSSENVGDEPSEMDDLLPALHFSQKIGSGLEGLRLVGGGGYGWVEVLYSGSWGLICDDGWDAKAAVMVCKDLGMAGGQTRFFQGNGKVGKVFIDNINCADARRSIRECTFRGWRVHDCSAKEAAGWGCQKASICPTFFPLFMSGARIVHVAGVQCDLDAWNDYTDNTVPGPAGRQDHTTVWDAETQSALLFGGHASSNFLYFGDVWRFDWASRLWSQVSSNGPIRSGHSAVWDAASQSMLVFAGRHLSTMYNDLYQFFVQTDSWQYLSPPSSPLPRADHSVVWDAMNRAMLVFAGEGAGHVLGDLHRYSLTANYWSESSASHPRARSRHFGILPHDRV